MGLPRTRDEAWSHEREAHSFSDLLTLRPTCLPEWILGVGQRGIGRVRFDRDRHCTNVPLLFRGAEGTVHRERKRVDGVEKESNTRVNHGPAKVFEAAC